MRLLMALPLLAGTACPALAGPLTFEEALDQARANAPMIEANNARVSASVTPAKRAPKPRRVSHKHDRR